jgi:CRISPR-associated endonuclease/helicase Cas3
MSPITLDEFTTYFQELHGREPYDWQCRLAKKVIEGTWSGASDLPTGSSKTSCLDIAAFALVCQSLCRSNNAPHRKEFSFASTARSSWTTPIHAP